MAFNVYDLGEAVRVFGEFRNLNNELFDPATVFVVVKNPLSVETKITFGPGSDLIKDSVGNYHFDINANIEGLWRYKFQSTGEGQASQDGAFRVEHGHFYTNS